MPILYIYQMTLHAYDDIMILFIRTDMFHEKHPRLSFRRSEFQYLFPTIRTWADNSRIKDLGDFPFFIGVYSAYQMHPHRHEYLELSFIIEGSNLQIINGKEYVMKPGTLTFLLPYQIHEMPLSSDRIKMYNCMFDLQFLFRSAGVKTGLNELLFLQNELPPSIQLAGKELEKFKGLMEELLEEQKESYLWKNDLLQLKLMEILIRFDRLRRQTLPADYVENIITCVQNESDRT